MSQGLAADCRYLRRTIDSSRGDGPLVCLCSHPVRDGFDCIGPFLEDMPTDCGFWEDGREVTRLRTIGLAPLPLAAARP